VAKKSSKLGKKTVKMPLLEPSEWFLELIRKLRKERSTVLQTGCTEGVNAVRRRLWV
jgi:hypothetical protein